ncbi:MAG: hypothetical protein ACP5NZ_04445, partial [Nanobdellota archaeon]
MENKFISLIFTFILCLSFASASLISDQGTDVRDISTGNLTTLANFTISIYDDSTGGTLIFEENFTEGIVNGSWNVMISPDLEYGRNYWKDYRINGEDLDFDGNERLEFQSSVGKINNVSFINFSLINSCSAGSSIRVIYENGSVECETDDAGAGSYNDAWINNTIDSKILTNNNSIVNWVTSTFASLANLVNLVGNWSADKSKYYNTTQVNEINTSVNNYILYVNSTNGAGSGTYSDSWINNTVDSKILTNNDSVNNYILYVNSTNGAGSSSYNDTWINQTIYNRTLVDDNITSTNLSMQNYVLYVNSTNPGSSAPYNDTWINQTIYNTTQVNEINTSVNNYILYVNSTNPGGLSSETDNLAYNGTLVDLLKLNNGTYTNVTNASYMTLDNFTIQNDSMKNYVLYVNSTNGAGSYNDGWINNTVDSKIITNNDSVNNYILYVNSTNPGSSAPYNDTWINQTIYNKTQVNEINTSMQNYVLYVNSTNGAGIGGEPNWNANYSTFLTHITWAIATNGTLFQTSQWNATNTSYYLDSNPYGYYNVTSNIGNWSSDKSSYTLLSVLNNGSYYNLASSEPLWNANYSTFLTHINWATAMNGTLAKSSELNNGTYITGLVLNNGTYIVLPTLNNGSYFNTPETDPSAYNGTLVDLLKLNNGTYTNMTNTSYIALTVLNNGTYIVLPTLNNGSYFNAPETDTLAYNGTLVDLLKLNNGTYTNVTNTSYMTGDNFTIQNDSMKNYVLYVNSTNGAGSGTYNDTWINQTIYNKTQVNEINTSMQNYVLYVNSTNPGGISVETDPYWFANYTNMQPN